MKHLRPLVIAIFALLACVSPALQLTAAIGVNVHIVARTSAPASEIADSRALIASIPQGTPLREDGIWHEHHWDRSKPIDTSGLRQKLGILASVKGPLLLVLTPLPWPGSPGWTTTSDWGYVAEGEIPEIAARFAQSVTAARAIWKELGRKESDLGFQIGNEAGAGHPGGWAALPRGEWWDRHGRLYVACLKAARFGYCYPIVTPAISFNDEDPAVAARELATAAPILKAMGPLVDLAAANSRTYAPWLTAGPYADLVRTNGVARANLAGGMAKRPGIVTELYFGTIDTPDVGAALDAYFAKPMPVPAWLYRYGEGDWLFSLPKGKVFPMASRPALRQLTSVRFIR